MKIPTTKLILVPPIDFHILVITFYYTVIVFVILTQNKYSDFFAKQLLLAKKPLLFSKLLFYNVTSA